MGATGLLTSSHTLLYQIILIEQQDVGVSVCLTGTFLFGRDDDGYGGGRRIQRFVDLAHLFSSDRYSGYISTNAPPCDYRGYHRRPNW